MIQATQVPGACWGRPAKSISDGFGHLPQARFPHFKHANLIGRSKAVFYRTEQRYVPFWSPSKYRTQSTICSRTLGPAMAPSLLMWPTTKTVIPFPFASCIMDMVQSFTWEILPGAESLLSLYKVCMESAMKTSGFAFLHSLQNIAQAGFRQNEQVLGIHLQPLGPELELALALLT